MNAIVLAALIVAAPAPIYKPHQKFTAEIRSFWRVTGIRPDGKDMGVHHRIYFGSARYNSEYVLLMGKSEIYVNDNKEQSDTLFSMYLNRTSKKPKIIAIVESYNNVIIKITIKEGFR